MINSFIIAGFILLGLVVYGLSTEKNLLKIIILIGLLNYPSMLLFSSVLDEVSGLVVLSIEAVSLCVGLIIAHYVWRYMKIREVGGK